MKRYVVRQAGIAETEFIREFAIEVPDDWTAQELEKLTLDELDIDNEIDWEQDDQSKIELNGQRVVSYDPSNTHCRLLPVVRFYSDVVLDYYEVSAEAQQLEAQKVIADAGSSA